MKGFITHKKAFINYPIAWIIIQLVSKGFLPQPNHENEWRRNTLYIEELAQFTIKYLFSLRSTIYPTKSPIIE